MTTDLSGRTTVVVGASRGLGRGIATAFAEAGAPVVAVARTGAALTELATTNWNRFGDAQADALLGELEKTDDLPRQHELMRALEQRFIETAPAIPLFANPQIWRDSCRFLSPRLPQKSKPAVGSWRRPKAGNCRKGRPRPTRPAAAP